MKQLADSKRRDIEYQVGDSVFLKLQPYRQHSVFKRAHQKLASKFYGPYQIEEKLGKVAYKLTMPPGSRIHPIFHVSQLKKAVGNIIAASTELPPISDDGDVLVEPERILDTRWIRKGSKFVEESLVKWKRLPVEDATWENTQCLQERYVNLDLEDKVPVKGRGTDKLRRSQRMPVKNSKYFD